MRPSPYRHSLAVLRHTIELNQKEMGDLVGRSPRTIQSIELGRHALSEELALRVAVETGVSMEWLCGIQPDWHPFVWGSRNYPYSKEHFEKWRACIQKGIRPTFRDIVGDEVAKENLGDLWDESENSIPEQSKEVWGNAVPSHFRQILAIIAAAAHKGRNDIVEYRLGKFIKSLEREFGQMVDEESLERGSALLEQTQWRQSRAKVFIEQKGPIVLPPYESSEQRGKVAEAEFGLTQILDWVDEGLTADEIMQDIERMKNKQD